MATMKAFGRRRRRQRRDVVDLVPSASLDGGRRGDATSTSTSSSVIPALTSADELERIRAYNADMDE